MRTIVICLVTMRSRFQVLETVSCRNAGKGCGHKTQSDRTLRKRELCASGCPMTMTGAPLLFRATKVLVWVLPAFGCWWLLVITKLQLCQCPHLYFLFKIWSLVIWIHVMTLFTLSTSAVLLFWCPKATIHVPELWSSVPPLLLPSYVSFFSFFLFALCHLFCVSVFYCLSPLFLFVFYCPSFFPLFFTFAFVSVFRLLWVLSLVYSNLLGTKTLVCCYCPFILVVYVTDLFALTASAVH
jgi:hypothetical protein